MPSHQQASLEQLINLLTWLDKRLETAVAAAKSVLGTETEQTPYRGIQIDAQEVDRLLTQDPAIPSFVQDAIGTITLDISQVQEASPLAWLQHSFTLDDFDLSILAIALAPELDRRYERLYVYLQDDVRCTRPTVDLSLNLLCTSAIEKLERRANFLPDAPLIRHGLLKLIPDPNQAQPALLAHIIKLDPIVIRLLLGESGLDERLKTFCQLHLPEIPIEDNLPKPDRQKALLTLVEIERRNRKPLTLYFSGIDKALKKHTAHAIAHGLQVPLFIVSLTNAKSDNIAEFSQKVQLLLLAVQFQNALIYIKDLEVVQTAEYHTLHQILLRHISQYSGIVMLAGIDEWHDAETQLKGVISLSFPMPDFEQRYFYWQHYLQAAGIPISDEDLRGLSDRFRLTSEQIVNAVATTLNQGRWENTRYGNSSPLSSISSQQLFTISRGLSGHDLKTLSTKIHPNYTWDDIVLPPYQKTQLREICDQVKYQHLVWEDWGFKSKKFLGRGLNVMFSGSSGTGKTMAAEVIAHELQLDLYKIDLSQIVSKYIGETEKNLNKIFNAATNANAILLFDEADALFGKRSNVKDAHDRYANLEVSYLLQKMEEYEGLAILTTNLRSNMDDAFIRRLQFIIDFLPPNEKQRHQIWCRAFPEDAPTVMDLGLSFLAHNFELTGANIRNIALMSAFLAAAKGSVIERTHVIQAIHREYQKMGKILKEQIEEIYLE